MKEKENESQAERDLYFKNLQEAFEEHARQKEILRRKFEGLWKKMKPLVVEKLKVKTDFLEVYKSQIQEHLINPEELNSEEDPTVIIKNEDGTFRFVLPEVNEKTIIEAAKKFRDEVEGHFQEALPAEELEKIPHILTLLYELGIIEVINQRFKAEGKDTGTDKARLIGTIIGRTEKKQVESIRKYLSAIDSKGHPKSPITGNSIKEVSKIMTEYGLQMKNLDIENNQIL
ncbi:hypothetical protein [Algoriphagus formosus]|uniref:Uncharacterized protein n=1 Tax=Algoriphagus formosus TaxID=2007308 RepID=A0A4R5VBU7_9BACT|nr:hypothetical protein [Algoriphagus aquimaris]TDK49524.1 hypothetical protein E1898_02830 [Algoriphagus aquimaris]